VQRPFVEAFLKALREAISKNGLQVVSRASNNQALQGEKYAKCLSFHPSQHPLHYPIK
jgi:hypothetical protein